MSNSELLRIKNKQKTTYKNQKTASSYKKRHKNGLMTDLGLIVFIRRLFFVVIFFVVKFKAEH